MEKTALAFEQANKRRRTRRTVTSNGQQRPRRKPVIVSALLRGQMQLECNLTPVDQDDSVSLVLWYKDNSMVPIYSVDARATPVQEARHKPGAWLEGRSTLRIVELQSERDEQEGGQASDNQMRRPGRGAARSRRATLSALSGGGGGGSNSSSSVGASSLAGGAPEVIESSQMAAAAGWPFKSRSRRHLHWREAPPGDDPASQEAAAEELRAESLALSGRLAASGERGSQAAISKQENSKRIVAQLHVDSLTSEDNGSYRCRVDFRRARSRIEELEVQVIVPAERPVIRDLSAPPGGQRGADQQQLAGNKVGPHNEGSRLVLECETAGGWPEPSLSWWHNGRLVDDSYEIVSALDGQVLEQRRASSEALELAPTDQQAAEQGQRAQQSAIDELLANEEQSTETPTTTTTHNSLSSQGGPNAQARLVRNRLEFGQLQRADLLANYSCRAINNKLGANPSSFVMIDMNLRPRKVQIDNERTPVLADKPLEIVCRAYGGRPAALISWFRGRTKLAPTVTTTSGEQRQREAMENVQTISEQSSADSNVTTSVLTIVPRLADSGQLISCRAEGNAVMAAAAAQSSDGEQQQQQQEAPLEDSWRLEVHHLPRVKLALGEKLAGKPVREQHDVYFECSVEAQPPAHELRWWHQGKELEANVSAGVIVSNQSLVLQRVKRYQQGHYTCSAMNSVGETHSNSVELVIEHAPYCADAPDQTETGPSASRGTQTMRHKTHYGAALGEPVRVHCHVEANPSESMSYKWAFVAALAGEQEPAKVATNWRLAGRQLVYLERNSIGPVDPMRPLENTATYTPRSELDYGSLLCWASNALGEQREPCVYQLIAAELPESPRNCRLLNATDSQLAVACELGYDGGQDQRMYMEVYDPRRPGELVANLTSTPGLSSALFAGGPPRNSIDANNGDEDSRGELNDEADDKKSQPSAGQAASLISETLAAAGSQRQPKQRHSSGQQQQQRQHAAMGQSKASSIGSVGDPFEAVFLTEPRSLAPATDYLLSIYAVNSRGSSEPIAFRAKTANESSMWSLQQRHSQLAKAGHLEADGAGGTARALNEVFALSWSPFLLVCAVTILIFALFATVTFAMIKYVDLTGMLLPSSHGGGAAAFKRRAKKADQKRGSKLARRDSSGQLEGNLQQQQQQQAATASNANTYVTSVSTSSASSARDSVRRLSELQQAQPHVGGAFESSLNNGAADCGEYSTLSTEVTESQANAPFYSGSNGRTARVIALDGDQQQQQQQLQLQAGVQAALHQQDTFESGRARLRQSNSSDNFLNQSDCQSSAAALLIERYGVANWSHARAPHYQTAYCNGTLPRNAQQQQQAWPAASLDEAQLDVRPFASGYLKVVAGLGRSASPGAIGIAASVTTGAVGATSAHQQYQAAAYGRDSLSSSISSSAAAATASGGGDGGEQPPHMVISQQQNFNGEQYIQQHRCGGGWPPARHLQVTSGALTDPYGQLLAANAHNQQQRCGGSGANADSVDCFGRGCTVEAAFQNVQGASPSNGSSTTNTPQTGSEFGDCNRLSRHLGASPFAAATTSQMLEFQVVQSGNSESSGYSATTPALSASGSFVASNQLANGSPSSGIGMELPLVRQHSPGGDCGERARNSTTTSEQLIQVIGTRQQAALKQTKTAKSVLLQRTNGQQQQQQTANKKSISFDPNSVSSLQRYRANNLCTAYQVATTTDDNNNNEHNKDNPTYFHLMPVMAGAEQQAPAAGQPLMSLKLANKARVRLIAATAAANNGHHQHQQLQQQQQQGGQNELLLLEAPAGERSRGTPSCCNEDDEHGTQRNLQTDV